MYLALLGLCFLPGEIVIVTKPQGYCEDHGLVFEAVCSIHCHFGEAAEQCGKLAELETYLSFTCVNLVKTTSVLTGGFEN